MRVTTKMAVSALVSNIDRSYERIARFQNQLSSGTRLNTLSDDPAAVERSLALRSELRGIEQYQKNINDGKGWLELTEATLNELEGVFVEARGLAVQGATSTYNSSQRSAIADQVDQFLEHALSLSEARYRGRYIFAGTQTENTPYVPLRDANNRIVRVQARGSSDGTIRREVSDGITMEINVSGEEIFEGPVKAFAVLITLRDALRRNDIDGVRESQEQLATMREGISSVRGRIGARVNRMEITGNMLERVAVEMTSVLSADEDVDLAATIVNLRQEEDVFQAALASGNSVIQQSLMDFIG